MLPKAHLCSTETYQPSYQCMQQWDAIHAMLIYESLELKQSIGDESGAWRLTAPVRGLGMGFLLKV